MRRFHYPVRRKIAQDFLFRGNSAANNNLRNYRDHDLGLWAREDRRDPEGEIRCGYQGRAHGIVIANNPTGRLLTIRGADT
jgi:hypothetical protein